VTSAKRIHTADDLEDEPEDTHFYEGADSGKAFEEDDDDDEDVDEDVLLEHWVRSASHCTDTASHCIALHRTASHCITDTAYSLRLTIPPPHYPLCPANCDARQMVQASGDEGWR
jgi:hypothetical protein